MSKTGRVSMWLLKIAVSLAVINPVLSIWMAAEVNVVFGLMAWLAGGLIVIGVGLAGLLGGSRSADLVDQFRREASRAEQAGPAGRGHSIAV